MENKETTLVCDRDFTITHCSGNSSDVSGLWEYVVGKQLLDGQFSYVDKEGVPFPQGEHPLLSVVAEKKEVLECVMGIKSRNSASFSWFLTTIIPTFDEQGEVSSLRINLVKEQVAVEKRDESRAFRRREDKIIRKAKDEWEKTFDAINDIITILDTDLTIIRANRAAHRLCKVDYGQLTGKKCYEVFEERESQCPLCPIQNENGNIDACTGVISNKKFGRIFDVSSSPIIDQSGTVTQLVHVARDVTQQKKRETERNLLSLAIEQAFEVIVITDHMGNIQYVNPAFSSMTGYSREEVLGKNPRFLKSGYHDQEFYREMWSTLLSGKVWSGRLVNRKKDTTLFHEDVTISPVSNFEGVLSNFVAVKRDISKEELLEKQLQQAMKMEAIGTLAGGIAHDFNNILSAMIGYGQIAKGQLAPNDPVHGDIDQILEVGDRAVDLVKQILTFSRKGDQKTMQPFKVQILLKEVVRLMRSSLPTTVDLVFNIDNECGPVLADSSQLHQVFMNLFANAKQAIGDEYGRITVNLSEIEVKDETKADRGIILQPGRYLHLEMSDTGAGMDYHIQQRIFDPFFSTKSKDHGTGLGLAVVHGIVKNHGGEISVSSEVGQGACFSVYLPVTDLEKNANNENVEQPLFSGSERIMVVDDEEVVARVIGNMLTKMGYKVTLFTNSLEAVGSFRTTPQNYDLIFTDMTMPDMTGAELAWEILSLRSDIPVILATGYSESIDKKKSERIGIKEFMMKPIKRRELSRIVRKVLDNG